MFISEVVRFTAFHNPISSGIRKVNEHFQDFKTMPVEELPHVKEMKEHICPETDTICYQTIELSGATGEMHSLQVKHAVIIEKLTVTFLKRIEGNEYELIKATSVILNTKGKLFIS